MLTPSLRRQEVAHFKFIEISGVAGSGKTSLAAALLERPDHEPSRFISGRDPSQLRHFVKSLPVVLPLYIENLVRPPRMSWADYKLMVYVTEGSSDLTAHAHQAKTIIADQGPIYALVRLSAKGLGVTDSSRFKRWWTDMFERWSGLLDLVIWLDAPNETLLERIESRPQPHVVKGGSPAEAKRFIDRYRELFLDALTLIEARDAAVVQRFDTSRMAVAQIASQVPTHLESKGFDRR